MPAGHPGPDAVQALRRQRVALGLRSPLPYSGMKRGRSISTHGWCIATRNATTRNARIWVTQTWTADLPKPPCHSSVKRV